MFSAVKGLYSGSLFPHPGVKKGYQTAGENFNGLSVLLSFQTTANPYTISSGSVLPYPLLKLERINRL